jgi:hypothetical protein
MVLLCLTTIVWNLSRMLRAIRICNSKFALGPFDKFFHLSRLIETPESSK